MIPYLDPVPTPDEFATELKRLAAYQVFDFETTAAVLIQFLRACNIHSHHGIGQTMSRLSLP